MRLLLAEDEKPLSRAVTAILQRSHYTVDTVYDGEEAREYFSGARSALEAAERIQSRASLYIN